MAYAGSSPWRISFRSRTDSVSAAMGAPERKGGEMAHRGEADATAETHSDSGTAQGVVPDGAARIPFAAAEIAPDAREAAARVLASGWVTTGPEVQAFEREFAAWVGAGHALAVSSCTAAIELALRGLDLPPGAKVLTSVLTFCGAVHAITHAGHQPVFADVDREGRRRRRHAGAALRRGAGARRRAGRRGRPATGPGGRGRRPRARDHRWRRRGRHQRGGHLLQLLRHQEPADRRGRHDH